jgi:hypothetical protein
VKSKSRCQATASRLALPGSSLTETQQIFLMKNIEKSKALETKDVMHV